MDTDDLIQEIAELWLAHGHDLESWHYHQHQIAERIAEQTEAAEEAIIRDSERIADEVSFIMGRTDYLDEAEHYYARRKGEREEELIRGSR